MFDAHLLSQNQDNKETEKKSEKTTGGKKITSKETVEDEASSAASDVKPSEPMEKQVALSQPSTNTYMVVGLISHNNFKLILQPQFSGLWWFWNDLMIESKPLQCLEDEQALRHGNNP